MKFSQTEKDKYHISLICGILQTDTNEFTCKTETDLQILKTNLLLPKGKGGRKGKLGHTHSIYTQIYKIINKKKKEKKRRRRQA